MNFHLRSWSDTGHQTFDLFHFGQLTKIGCCHFQKTSMIRVPKRQLTTWLQVHILSIENSLNLSVFRVLINCYSMLIRFYGNVAFWFFRMYVLPSCKMILLKVHKEMHFKMKPFLCSDLTFPRSVTISKLHLFIS